MFHQISKSITAVACATAVTLSATAFAKRPYYNDKKAPNSQEDLKAMTVTGESGAGLVKATASAKGELRGLDIDPSIFNSDDKEVVEDLILAAIKEAQTKAQEKAQEEMQKLTSEMGLPADMKLPF